MTSKRQQKILISGGAGFIGSALVRMLLAKENTCVVNVDALNYAGDLARLEGLSHEEQARYQFYHLDICDAPALEAVFLKEQPDAVMHLAAQTHVDRSIDAPLQTVQTNVMGTLSMLEAARSYWQKLPAAWQQDFRFLHVSTDEVYGDIAAGAQPSTEGDVYAPNSPYSASKAGADHLVRAWHKTYGLPVLLTHCCNNYGAYQHPEKLIPHMILNAFSGNDLPVYGDGKQQRQWIFVEDHARALECVLERGSIGETYHIGTADVISNIDLVRLLCEQLETLRPASEAGFESYEHLIAHVADRPGHDRRYELATDKIRNLGWQPQVSLGEGLLKTVHWYVKHRLWLEQVFVKGYILKRQGVANPV
ncbi:MAG: dTDP-glucose 4,6-dehydratase [Saezia sp.]